jgi:hypothetical protein
MADNRPNAPKELKADKANEKPTAEMPEANKEPLTPESTEPQVATGPGMQEAADQSLLQSRGTVWGDLTSSNGNQNVDGLHGRDGGVTGSVDSGKPHNPAPSENAISGEKADDNEKEA